MVSWGRKYLVVSPEEFRIDYMINPYMNPDVQPDRQRSAQQWQQMCDALRANGADVETLAPVADCPDMVYAMNLGQAWVRGAERHVLMSHMRFEQRRGETAAAAAWFADNGFTVHWLAGEPPREVAGVIGQWDANDLPAPSFESGDAFWFGDKLIVAYGARTDQSALPRIAQTLGVDVIAVHITHPAMFHLDLAFCPLTDTAALVCLDAFEADSRETLLSHIPDPVEVTIDQALAFAANAVVVGNTVIGSALDLDLTAQLEQRGLTIDHVDVSEFHLSGGSIRCLTNPLDITLN